MTDDAPGVADPDAVRANWSAITVMWADTIEHAREVPEATLHERVKDEWSFVESLRHLIFVTDSWVRRTILSDAHAYHPLALPPDFVVDVQGWGIDLDASPSFDDVYAARRDRMATVQQVVDDITAATLVRACDANRAPGFPPKTTATAAHCLDIVMKEEAAHHRFAVRDLAVLEGRYESE